MKKQSVLAFWSANFNNKQLFGNIRENNQMKQITTWIVKKNGL